MVATLAGLLAAMLLQSSTAVAVLISGFVRSGQVSLVAGIAIMLGADLGSAAAVQILSLELGWLVPLLLIAGGWMFMQGKSRSTKQFGRILLGIAFVLIALAMMSDATLPLRESDVVPLLVGYFQSDLLSAFLLGAAVTWAIHSSVASVLMVVTLAFNGIIPVNLGVALVLGANLGSGLVAYGLMHRAGSDVRRLVVGNLAFRAFASLAFLTALYLLPDAILLVPSTLPEGVYIAAFHLAFNTCLMVCGLFLVGAMARAVTRVVRPTTEEIGVPTILESRLDTSVAINSTLALANAKRELLRMGEIVACMLEPLMELYEIGDPERIKQVKKLEAGLNRAQKDVKLYLARISASAHHTGNALSGHDLANFAINLEHVGDAIAKSLVGLAESRRDQGLQFSAAGWRELNELHIQVLQNLQLSLHVMMSEDREAARQLLIEKDAAGKAGRASAAEHLVRLRDGTPQSLSTSNIHLETVRALKSINSLLASAAYPILIAYGDLNESRFSDNLEGDRAV